MRRQSGAAAVEFALVSVLLVALLLTAVDMGRALHARLVLTAAVREGGRRAALDAGGGPRTTGKVSAAMAAGGLDPLLAAVVVEPAGAVHYGRDLTVRVRYPLALYSPVSRALFGELAWVQAALVTRSEGTHHLQQPAEQAAGEPVAQGLPVR